MKKKNLLARVIIIVVVTLVGLYLVIGPRRRPNLRDFTWSGIKTSLASNIRLGLDLQGGSHLVMRVKTEEYLRRLTEENYIAAQNGAKDAGYEIKGGQADTSGGNYRIVLEPADPSKAAEIKDAVEKKGRTRRHLCLELQRVWCTDGLEHDGSRPETSGRQRHDTGAQHHR